ncbi:protein Cep89 homolog isoform X2 [Anopheles aquasalis]|uniref:protein Cep89 homolog isoform X2 n=1 Tax=Anopheles aquasalis TaxID=42839 RepID=UPI00215B736F|nr:protein Cep89 homolog isoform X2 [Anopheles aquasalis]
MPFRLPKRRNVEPVLQILTQLIDDQSDISSISVQMGGLYRVPADSLEPQGTAKQSSSRLPVRTRVRRKFRDHGLPMTHAGTVVSRSKSVDDLTAGVVASDDDELDGKPNGTAADRRLDQLERTLRSKEQQIGKLVEKLTSVFECNNQFAIEHERLQKDYQQVVQNLRTLETSQAKSCERCAAHDTATEQLTKENADLRNDLKMMKILVYRLNVQIERYQDTVREGQGNIPKLDFVDSTYGGVKDNLNWGSVNAHTLGPLLNAYEEMIAEKTDLVQQYETELVTFTGRLKQVLEENESLQRQMEEVRASQTGWTDERTRLQAQVSVLRSKAELQAKRADLAKEKLVEVLKCYEQKVQAQCLDIERLQEAYTRSKGELTTLRNLNQNPEIVADSLKECQKLFAELKLQHNADRTRMTEETDTIRRELQQKTTELDQLQQDYRQQLGISERQKEINEILMGKNGALKQTLERTRQSKEILKQRLKTMISWGKGSEQRKDQLQDSWRTIRALQEQLQQRDGELQTLQQRYQLEVEQLQRRLRQREETLRKILADKAQIHRRL